LWVKEGCGKDAAGQSPKNRLFPRLGNPAKNAGFPLSHSPDCDWVLLIRRRKSETNAGVRREKQIAGSLVGLV
jgi:hypothetical protein